MKPPAVASCKALGAPVQDRPLRLSFWYRRNCRVRVAGGARSDLETAVRKLLIGTIAATLAAAGANAADMAAPTYAKAPVMAPAYSWSGFYIGVNGGYGWEDPTVVLTPNDPNVVGSPVSPASWTNSGGFGGGQIGYNYQFARQWLAGLEADIDVSGLKGSGSSAVRPFQNLTSQNVDWFGTVRGRLGWLPTDRFLVFATGGLAYG